MQIIFERKSSFAKSVFPFFCSEYDVIVFDLFPFLTPFRLKMSIFIFGKKVKSFDRLSNFYWNKKIAKEVKISKLSFHFKSFEVVAVAQLEEWLPPTPHIRGSNPIVGRQSKVSAYVCSVSGKNIMGAGIGPFFRMILPIKTLLWILREAPLQPYSKVDLGSNT